MHDAMTALAKSAADDVAASRRQVADYREYVETWVHEAKTPLATARLMLENLRGDAANMESKPNGAAAGSLELTARVRALDEELDRLEGYIEQALFYARSETLDRDYLVRPYALRDLVSGAVRANARSLIATHVAPELGDLGEMVFTDEKWMGFILGQVIQNSVKHARSEGARITFSSRVVGEGTADERVELSVADNGCGVPADELPRVFDKGFTGTLGRSGKKATGIGLYLVKRLCDKMGVAVRAESVEGEGFTVVFGFPTDKYHYFES